MRTCCCGSGSGSGSGAGFGPSDSLCCKCSRFPGYINISIALSCGATFTTTLTLTVGSPEAPNCTDPTSGSTILKYEGGATDGGAPVTVDWLNCDGTVKVGGNLTNLWSYGITVSCVKCYDGTNVWICNITGSDSSSGYLVNVTANFTLTVIHCVPLIFDEVLLGGPVCSDVSPTISGTCCDGIITCDNANFYTYGGGCTGGTLRVNISE